MKSSAGVDEALPRPARRNAARGIHDELERLSLELDRDIEGQRLARIRSHKSVYFGDCKGIWCRE